MKLVIISDTHGMHEKVTIPDGDVFIHCGDVTKQGTLEEVEAFNEFLDDLPHQHKILVAGNHDFCFERQCSEAEALLTNGIYLRDSSVEINGFKFYGSPWQPWFFDFAFNLKRGDELKAKWDLIDKDTDILITHTPPFGHGDEIMSGEKVGCEELIKFVDAIKPPLHIFGHIHEGYGITRNQDTTFINASTCDSVYEPVNNAVVYDL